ncbi:MAG: hypothetical protein ABSF03_12760 [Streptosporangiaceae bacterium]|jgi:hypothetical protein
MGPRADEPKGQWQKTPAPAVTDSAGGDRPVEHRDAFVTGGAYGVLFVLGAVEAIMGSFEYSWTVGPVPAAALGCCAALLVTCLLAGWAMRSLGGALLPAIAWILVSFLLAMPDAPGSVIITNTASGEWYLYGGAISAAIGVAVAFAIWVRGMTGAKPVR